MSHVEPSLKIASLGDSQADRGPNGRGQLGDGVGWTGADDPAARPSSSGLCLAAWSVE